MVIGTPTNAGNKTHAYVEGWSRKEGAERERGIERQMTTPLAQRPLKNQTHCSAATGLDMVTMDTDMDIGTADTHTLTRTRTQIRKHARMHALSRSQSEAKSAREQEGAGQRATRQRASELERKREFATPLAGFFARNWMYCSAVMCLDIATIDLCLANTRAISNVPVVSMLAAMMGTPSHVFFECLKWNLMMHSRCR